MLLLEEPIVETRESRITNWYLEVFPLFAGHVRKRGGDLEEAKEVFQETIVLYYEKMLSSDFQPHLSDKAYLMGIAKKLWLKHMEAKQRTVTIDGVEVIAESRLEPIAHKLLAYLKQSGAKCMDLLQTFYYEKLSMKDVAERFGYTSERSATVQKFKCLEMVRDEVKQQSLSYEDFLD